MIAGRPPGTLLHSAPAQSPTPSAAPYWFSRHHRRIVIIALCDAPPFSSPCSRFCSSGCYAAPGRPRIGTTAPDFTAQDADRKIDSHDLHGKIRSSELLGDLVLAVCRGDAFFSTSSSNALRIKA